MGTYPDAPDDLRCRKWSASECRCHPVYQCTRTGTHWEFWDDDIKNREELHHLFQSELGVSWLCDGPHAFLARADSD